MTPDAHIFQSDTLGVTVKGIGSATAVVFLSDSLNLALPWLIVALVVVFADLYFGIAAAKHKGEQVRGSRAIRRTVGKIAEYLCWVILASTLAVAFEFRPLTKIVLGVVIVIEGISIVQNWLSLRGKRLEGLEEFAKGVIKDKTGHDTSMLHLEDNNKQNDKDK